MFGNTSYDVFEKDSYRYIKLESGKSAKQLVFLHGMFGGLSNFDPLLDSLGSRYDCFIPEIPLYDLPKSRMKIIELAKWLETALDAQGFDEVVVMGNSLGGHIALEFTHNYPERVEALVLTGSAGLFENQFGNTMPRRFDREYIKKRAGETFYHDILDDTIIDEIMGVIKDRKKLMNLLKLARATHKYNMEEALAHIYHRTLLIWGENDEITPPEVAHQFMGLMPNAELKWIDECGHAPMMEHPKVFAEYLKEFLIELENDNHKINKSGYGK